MADLSKYEVYTRAMELADAVMKSYQHFHVFRYTLGTNTVNKSLELIDCVVRGLDGFDKKRKLKNFLEAIDLTQEIESRILLAADNQCLGNEYAGWYIDNIPDLRKQLEKLANSQKSQLGLSTDGQRTCD
jgi:hypothetical protein